MEGCGSWSGAPTMEYTMRDRFLVVGLGVALMMALSLVRAEEPRAGETTDTARIGKLIDQLGSDSFADREQARRDLEAIGVPALQGLRRAETKGDLETSRRVAELIRTIEETKLTAELLSPKKVHLKLKDVPVLQAVEMLAKLSGYAMRVDGDRTLLTGKTVTLDTGLVTFWEAVDRLGEKAGLTEKSTIASIPGDPNQDGIVMDRSYSVPVREAGPAAGRRPGKRLPPPPPPLRLTPLPAQLTDKESAEKQASEKQKEAEAPPPMVLPGVVILAPATAAKQHINYAGATRMVLKQARPSAAKPQAMKHCDLVLETIAEPRLLVFATIGVPTIARAIDEHGQALSFVIDPPSDKPTVAPDPINIGGIGEWSDLMPSNRPVPRGVTIRLNPGTKAAKRLKELTGSVTGQVLMPNTTLATLDLKSAGKYADIKGGGRLQVVKFEKIGAPGPEMCTLVYSLDGLPGGGNPNMMFFRGNRQIVVNGMPVAELLDAKGKRLAVASGPSLNQEQGPDGQVVKTTVTMVFRRDPGQGEPGRLVLTGMHTATIVVPFRFEDVLLP
jgi:hypothetical protein